MARLSKANYPKILQMVDGEQRKVAEVAAEYACTPAAIYALLRKLRPAAAAPVAAVVETSAPAVVPDLFAAPPPSDPPSATITALASRVPRGRAGLGAALAKPGVGLVMRTSDGEDSLTPFRSIDDLLSSIKPILRGAARSPDPVWFSIQPVDLASLDEDAA